jgi:hypothetical protein
MPNPRKLRHGFQIRSAPPYAVSESFIRTSYRLFIDWRTLDYLDYLDYWVFLFRRTAIARAITHVKGGPTFSCCSLSYRTGGSIGLPLQEDREPLSGSTKGALN